MVDHKLQEGRLPICSYYCCRNYYKTSSYLKVASPSTTSRRHAFPAFIWPLSGSEEILVNYPCRSTARQIIHLHFPVSLEAVSRSRRAYLDKPCIPGQMEDGLVESSSQQAVTTCFGQALEKSKKEVCQDVCLNYIISDWERSKGRFWRKISHFVSCFCVPEPDHFPGFRVAIGHYLDRKGSRRRILPNESIQEGDHQVKIITPLCVYHRRNSNWSGEEEMLSPRKGLFHSSLINHGVGRFTKRSKEAPFWLGIHIWPD